MEKPTRREFLLTVGATAVSAGAFSCAAHAPGTRFGASPAAPKRPNFVIVLCDDLGYGDLSCYGHPIIETPCLDQFALEGMRLTDCYASAPVCSPSRCGMLTGRTPYRYSVYDWIPADSPMHLPANEVTVATLLRSAGYATCHVGKWHCNGRFNSPEQPQPCDHGFEYWFSTQNNAEPTHENPDNFVRNGTPVGRLEGFSSTLIVDEAIRWLESLPPDRPYCLFVWFHSPHEPVASAKEFVARYPDAVTPEQAIYFGNVTQMDYEFGRLMSTLDRMDSRENTFVLFTSDNGPETLNRYRGASRSYGSPGPLRGMKLHLYEGGIRVPGMVRWPGGTRPRGTCQEPVNNTDMLPTLCSLAAVATPSDRSIDGANLAPIFEDRPIARTVPLYWRYDRALSAPKVAMRQGDWKILADAALTQFELYNVREDPAETQDLADGESGRVRRMAATLRELDAEVKAEGGTCPERV